MAARVYLAEADTGGARWAQLTLLAAVQVLAMSVWFAGSLVLPMLRSEIGLTDGEAGWLTSAVQIGFVVGTLTSAVLNLPDIIPARWLVAAAALGAASANAAMLFVDDFTGVLISRVVTGMALAGVYPPAMKMAATWFRSGRGLAIGVVVGALTLGKAVPYLLGGRALSIDAAVLVPSIGATVAAILVASLYRDGPNAFPSRPFSWRLTESVARDPSLRRVTAGYLGHMWELYAYWTWIPAFLAAAALARHTSVDVGAWAFACVAIGAVGCIWGGQAADRVGRVRVVRISLLASGTCGVASALLFNAPFWLLLCVCLLWGVAVIADSAQFSALITELAPPHAVGTALTLQTSLGFMLTVGSIQLVPIISGGIGWRWAMVVLAIGPAIALLVVRRTEART